MGDLNFITAFAVPVYDQSPMMNFAVEELAAYPKQVVGTLASKFHARSHTSMAEKVRSGLRAVRKVAQPADRGWRERLLQSACKRVGGFTALRWSYAERFERSFPPVFKPHPLRVFVALQAFQQCSFMVTYSRYRKWPQYSTLSSVN